MVTRMRLGGVPKHASSYARTLQPENVKRLASYIYVERALLLKLIETGMQVQNVDQIRALLILHMNPGSDISSPLDSYDELVMALATTIVNDNLDLIEEELQKVQGEALGLEFPEEVISKEGEGVEKETVSEGITPEGEITRREEVYIPPKIKVTNKKTGEVTERAKSVAWRKRKQPGLSSQEQFVYARVGQPVEQTQHEYIQYFKIYRSPLSIRMKQVRLVKRVSLSKEEHRGEESGGMAPT